MLELLKREQKTTLIIKKLYNNKVDNAIESNTFLFYKPFFVQSLDQYHILVRSVLVILFIKIDICSSI